MALSNPSRCSHQHRQRYSPQDRPADQNRYSAASTVTDSSNPDFAVQPDILAVAPEHSLSFASVAVVMATVVENSSQLVAFAGSPADKQFPVVAAAGPVGKGVTSCCWTEKLANSPSTYFGLALVKYAHYPTNQRSFHYRFGRI